MGRGRVDGGIDDGGGDRDGGGKEESGVGIGAELMTG